MIVLVATIQKVDEVIYHFLNGFAGHPWMDYFANFEENDNLLKGGLFLAAFWYLWFRSGPEQERRRKAIVAILVGSLLALVAARVIANFAPFRVRPMNDLRLEHHAYSFPVSAKLVHWSSFPSDNATFFFALAFGLAYLWRRFAVPAMLYTAVWICLPRIFLGVHYASDVVVGAAIGIATVWICLKVDWFQAGLGARVAAWADAKPEVFHAVAFLAVFEMAILFDDVRGAGSDLAHFLSVSPARDVVLVGLGALAALCMVALAALFLSVIHIRTGPARGNVADAADREATPANRQTVSH
jgi:undecaprenyl-diphosphatase